jgi:hypothetical protein
MLKINNSTFLWKKWEEAGITYIGDIIKENGEFMNINDIFYDYNIRSNFLELMQIKTCIPKEIKCALDKPDMNILRQFKQTRTDKEILFLQRSSILSLNTCLTKNLYWLLMDKITAIPKSVEKWISWFPKLGVMDENFWSEIFKNVFTITCSTKLQSFQYKIINNIINCKEKLLHWKIKDNDNCYHCNEKDTIIHYFIFCPITKQFWKSLLTWWNRLSEVYINLLRDDLFENIIFGFKNVDIVFVCLNYIILLGKYFIYVKRNKEENNICFFEYLSYLKWNLIIEREVCKRKKDKTKLANIDWLLENI